MRNEDKTKEQLIDELVRMRQRIAALEKVEREQMVEALRENEKFLSDIFESVQDGISVLSTDLIIRRVNSPVKKWYAQNLPLEGKKCYEAYHNRDAPCDQCPTLRCLKSGQTEREIVPGLSGSSAELMELFSYPVKEQNSGKVTGVVEFVRDITEVIRSERRIKHLNTLLRAIRNVNQLITREKDRNRLIQGVCDYLIETRGYYSVWIALLDNSGELLMTTEAGLGDNFLPMAEKLRNSDLPICVQKTLEQSDLVITENPSSDCADCPLSANYSGRGAMIARLEYHEKIFGVIAISVSKNLLYDEEEQALFKEVAGDLSFALHDIELGEIHDQAVKALRESEEKYRQLVENANEAILVAQDGMIKFLNPKLIEITGYPEKEIISKPFVEFIHPEDRDMVLERYLKRLEGKALPHIYTFRLVDKFGNVKWVEINSIKIFWEDQPATLNFLSDVTERKKMEEELQKIDKLESIGVLAGGIAHDFNNLLTGILGNISLAKMYCSVDAPFPTERVIERLAEVEDATLKSRRLTQQLLTFAEGGMPIKETASISDLLKDTAQFALRGSNVKCTFSIPDDLWVVEVDKGQIGQVIQNLVINADHAMPTGGVLKIGAENVIISDQDNLPLKDGKYIKISVEDEGMGIPKEYLTKVFDPYFTTKDKGPKKGTGLGLAICYSILEKHDGYIIVESELGVGTTFYAYLPAYSRKQISAEKKVEKQPLVGKGKILLMDDEEIVRNVTEAILNHLGYDVELAEEGSEAIEIYQKAKESGQPFDAVILDLTVPGGMGGKEAIKKFLEIDPEVKAIVSSGFSNVLIMSNFDQYGFSGVVAKPYNVKELGDTLHKVIRG